MKFKKTFTILSLLLLLLIASYTAYVLLIPTELNEPLEIEIRKGESFSDVVQNLYNNRLVRNMSIILLLSRITQLDRKVKTGFYSFSGRVSAYGVIERLISGKRVEVEVTIPEGFNIRHIARKLESARLISSEKFLSLAWDRGFLDSLGIDAPSLEGYIYPDTYRFPRGMPAEDIIRFMVENMRRRFTQALKERASSLGLSEREVLTLASIIEKEARVDSERPLISAVFHNRLKIGMPLQADPTSIYGFKDFTGKITAEDLKRDSPYNTYVIKGLPPGPIASPGLKSILAALYPADVPYLYFVSSSNGRHHFSVTGAEHIKAVRLYRR
jgi:UPF0755 protein